MTKEITEETTFQTAEVLAGKLGLTRAENLLETLTSLTDGHFIMVVESHEIRVGRIDAEVYPGNVATTICKDLNGDEIFRWSDPISESYRAFEEPPSANLPANAVLYYLAKPAVTVNEKWVVESIFSAAETLAEEFGLTRAQDNDIAFDDISDGGAIVIAQPTGIIAGRVSKKFVGEASDSEMESIMVSRRFIRTVFKPYSKNRKASSYIDEGSIIFTTEI